MFNWEVDVSNLIQTGKYAVEVRVLKNKPKMLLLKNKMICIIFHVFLEVNHGVILIILMITIIRSIFYKLYNNNRKKLLAIIKIIGST